ncbi:S41 family peptidase [Sporosarcina saromensis]|uniref:S41 family peptidase n=1 Tax=Sporosarcina saromensis TaxID=359365 RepID=A0ABU4GB70_9BACL|nr:S41 family peptidase [Sporosarcina saromensis]MDW0114198.1 S41 family peptidase [Sporosarcina saromensis]
MEKIFNEIVHIMQNDYAGCKDKKGWDRPDYFLDKIRAGGELSKLAFKEIVDEYLLDFKDRHLYFLLDNAAHDVPKNRGFNVRRYKDRLYVTEVVAETRLQIGMSFATIGGYTIPELKEKHHRLLNENHTEREKWMPILMQYEEGQLDVGDELLNFTFDLFDKKQSDPTYAIEKVAEDTLLLTMTDFMNPDAIAKLVGDHEALLRTTDKWIVDVRVNNGGSDSSYYSLLPYLLPEEGLNLADTEDKMLMYCTEASAQRVLPDLEEAINQTEDEQARFVLQIFKREWDRNRGKGFVEFDFSELAKDAYVKGTKQPSEVIVLTDVMCGSAGDSFVELVKMSSKVTVIGRPTLGVNDYSNLVSAKWGEGFELMYPTSRLSRIDKGEGMTGVGITPHVYIPWTPEHLEEDVDMKKALELLSTEKVK